MRWPRWLTARSCVTAISTKMIDRIFSGAVTRYVSPGFCLVMTDRCAVRESSSVSFT